MSAVAPAVADAVRARWPQRGPAWLDALPAELHTLCRDLDLTPTGRTFPARFAHVVETTTRSGARVVLRSSPDPDAVHQAAVLEHLARIDLAPAVHAVRHTPAATWTAMDAIAPGTSLAEDDVTGSDWASAGTMLRALSAETSGPPTVPSIVPWLRARLAAPPVDDQPSHRGPAPAGVRRTASIVLDQLAQQTPGALCHGDLSPSNVLRGPSRLWLIDPRGMNGEPAYDIGVIALKASRDDVTQAHVLATRLALHSDNDPERAAAWVTIADAATV